MRVGYPCINRGIGCSTNSTFRLASYSERRLVDAVSSNLDCLMKVLNFNAGHELYFFRISSDIVPFASHPVCNFDWGEFFSDMFSSLGDFVRRQKMRISMHPDQFVLINSIRQDVVERSVRELEYHCRVLDLMGLGLDAKVQIHVGGVYGDKEAALLRFVENYRALPICVRRRLVIENDERLFSVRDCLRVHELCGVPVLFDSFHHECLNNGESTRDALEAVSRTWIKAEGPVMVDYSSQKDAGRRGAHAEHIDISHFGEFVDSVSGIDFDLMLEIKDKEKSAIIALEEIRKRGLI